MQASLLLWCFLSSPFKDHFPPLFSAWIFVQEARGWFGQSKMTRRAVGDGQRTNRKETEYGVSRVVHAWGVHGFMRREWVVTCLAWVFQSWLAFRLRLVRRRDEHGVHGFVFGQLMGCVGECLDWLRCMGTCTELWT